MVFDMFNIYKSHNTFRKVYLKHFSRSSIVTPISLIIILVALLYLLYYLYKFNWVFVIMPFTLWIVIPFIVRQKLRIARDVYKVDTIKAVTKLGHDKFKAHLEELNITTLEQLNYLIELIDKNAQSLKIPFFINRAIIVAVLGPVWVELVKYCFNRNEPEMIALLFVLIFLIFLTWFFMHSLKMIVFDEFLNGDYNKMKRMSDLVRDIYLIKLNSNRK